MTDEHRAAQVEPLEDAPYVFREVVDRMAGFADGGLAVAPPVEGKGAEAGSRDRVELLRPGA